MVGGLWIPGGRLLRERQGHLWTFSARGWKPLQLHAVLSRSVGLCLGLCQANALGWEGGIFTFPAGQLPLSGRTLVRVGNLPHLRLLWEEKMQRLIIDHPWTLVGRRWIVHPTLAPWQGYVHLPCGLNAVTVITTLFMEMPATTDFHPCLLQDA